MRPKVGPALRARPSSQPFTHFLPFQVDTRERLLRVITHGEEVAVLPLSAATEVADGGGGAPSTTASTSSRVSLDAPGSPFGTAAGIELELQGADEAALFWDVVRDLLAGTHAGCK